jgi:hypothetical protein
MAVTIQGSGQVPIQVVTVNKTDTFTTTSGTFVDITGLSITITPTSATSKILILASIAIGSDVFTSYIRLMRGSTVLNVGDAASTRPQVTGAFGGYGGTAPLYGLDQVPVMYIDSPATTSSVTYNFQTRPYAAGQVSYINRTSADRDTSNYDWRTPSNIVLMEIAG